MRQWARTGCNKSVAEQSRHRALEGIGVQRDIGVLAAEVLDQRTAEGGLAGAIHTREHDQAWKCFQVTTLVHPRHLVCPLFASHAGNAEYKRLLATRPRHVT